MDPLSIELRKTLSGSIKLRLMTHKGALTEKKIIGVSRMYS